ncbi:MAG: hypothetical protein PHH98_00630 [Candidatus Gracilibacteria bacterium]|nr:hypothetical protein [Candidatus Gracilibacteria bacterium]
MKKSDGGIQGYNKGRITRRNNFKNINMEKLEFELKHKNKKGLAESIQSYSRIIAISVAAILGTQTSDSIADNLLSDTDVKISSPIKESVESKQIKNDLVNTLSVLMLESNYKYIEFEKGVIKAIEQKLQDNCNLYGENCDIEERISIYKEVEKEIISFFENKIFPGFNTISIKLNKKNTSTILDLLPYIEIIFKIRYGEKYMDVLDVKSIKNEEYTLIINIDNQSGEYKIGDIGLVKNK